MKYIRHFYIKRLLSAYIDNEASPKDIGKIVAHLKECPDCRKNLEELKAVSNALRKWPDQQMSPDLASKIQNDFLGGKYKGVKMDSSNIKKTLTGVLGVLLVVLVSYALMNQLYSRAVKGKIMYTAENIGSQSDYEARQVVNSINGLQTRGLASQTYQGVQYSAADKTKKSQYEPYYADSTTQGYSENVARESLKAVAGRVYPASPAEVQFNNGYSVMPSYSGGESAKQGFVRAESENLLLQEKNKEIETTNNPVVVIDNYLPAVGTEDKIIRNATLGMEVADVNKGYESAAKIVKEYKGYLAGTKFSQDAKSGRNTAQIVVRVPKEKLEDFLDSLKALGEVKNVDIKSTDVSSEYNQLIGELKSVKLIYDKILEKLSQKKTDIDTSIQLTNELSPYAAQMNEIKARLAEYDNMIAMSTVTIDMYTVSYQLYASMFLDAQDAAKASESIEAIARANNGEVVQVDLSQNDSEKVTGTIVVKIANDKAQTAIGAVKKLGEVKNFSFTNAESLPVDMSAELAKRNNKGNTEITVNISSTSWDLLWKESLKQAKGKMMRARIDTLNYVVDHLGQVIGLTIVSILFIVVLLKVIALAGKLLENKNNDQK